MQILPAIFQLIFDDRFFVQIVLASSNSGKIFEIQQLLSPFAVQIIPQTQLGVADIEEVGLTFVENAILKARNAAAHTHLPAIADDSGLEVDKLQGAPGVFSARYAGKNATNETRIEKLLTALKDVPLKQRQARFQSVIVYLKHPQDPSPIICQGTWEGEILLDPQGNQGFGYDPIFYVPQYRCSAAELPLEVKNQISHRSQALRQLIAALRFATRSE
jgi:XTP/dITP diphosphohydrolase